MGLARGGRGGGARARRDVWTMAQTVMMMGETVPAVNAGALSAVLTGTPFGKAALVGAGALGTALECDRVTLRIS